jgi:hypothetical protein
MTRKRRLPSFLRRLRPAPAASAAAAAPYDPSFLLALLAAKAAR